MLGFEGEATGGSDAVVPVRNIETVYRFKCFFKLLSVLWDTIN